MGEQPVKLGAPIAPSRRVQVLERQRSPIGELTGEAEVAAAAARTKASRSFSGVPQLRQEDEVEVGGEDGGEGYGQEETVFSHY